MQWRPIVMMAVGLTMVFLVSLISDPPYPRPVQLASDNHLKTATTFSSSSSFKAIVPANEVILTVAAADGFLYQTTIWFETADAFKHGIGPMKTGTKGVIEQRRKPIDTLYSNQTALLEEDNDWTLLFQHELQGPISKVSRAPPPQQEVQFAVMYHKLINEDPQHIIRVYYLPSSSSSSSSSSPGATNMMHFKDLVMPGTTWIETFTLEHGSILYSRDPDWYRFRIAHLPSDLTSSPHSVSLPMNNIQNGPHIHKYYQPRNTELHEVMLARLYSPEEDTYRVLSLDVHKTHLRFWINITIADSLNNDAWIRRDHETFSRRVYSGESLQYMAFVDGTSHLHQDRVEVKMPSIPFTRSANGQTLTTSYIRHKFLTFDFTNRTNLLQYNEDESQYLYRGDPKDEEDSSSIVPEYFFWADDELELVSDYDDIVGMQVNDAGTILAIWTDSNTVYIYQRNGSPHNRIVPLGWSLRMVINDLNASRVGTVAFWKRQEKNYMVLGLKNQQVRSYLIDQSEQAEKPGFWHFLIERWNMLTAMSIVIAVFVFNESHRPSV